MHCVACGRRLLLPAFTAPASMGSYVLGPKCAEKAGVLVKPGRKGRAVKLAGRAEVLPGQMALDLQYEPTPTATIFPPA